MRDCAKKLRIWAIVLCHRPKILYYGILLIGSDGDGMIPLLTGKTWRLFSA